MDYNKAIVSTFCVIILLKFAEGNVDPWLRVPTCKTITNSNLCVQLGSKFYLIEANHKLNWWDAQRFCQRNKANLVTIENSREMKLIVDYLNSHGYKGESFHISGNDLGSQPGTFYSIATGNLLPFTAWTPGEPNNDQGREHCAEIWYINGYTGMNDGQCIEESNFICEFGERLPDQTLKSAVCDL